MRHYFWILIMTWVSMAFILFSSWGLLLFGVDLGDFTIFVPIMFALSGVVVLSRTSWFDENIRRPLAETLDFASYVEVIIHVQLFTVICGVLGMGVGVATMASFYPMGVEMMVKGFAKGNIEWHTFTKYAPMAMMSGFSFGVILYSYLFADASNLKWLTRGILLGGFLSFFLLGLIFGDDRYFFVITN